MIWWFYLLFEFHCVTSESHLPEESKDQEKSYVPASGGSWLHRIRQDKYMCRGPNGMGINFMVIRVLYAHYKDSQVGWVYPQYKELTNPGTYISRQCIATFSRRVVTPKGWNWLVPVVALDGISESVLLIVAIDVPFIWSMVTLSLVPFLLIQFFIVGPGCGGNLPRTQGKPKRLWPSGLPGSATQKYTTED